MRLSEIVRNNYVVDGPSGFKDEPLRGFQKIWEEVEKEEIVVEE